MQVAASTTRNLNVGTGRAGTVTRDLAITVHDMIRCAITTQQKQDLIRMHLDHHDMLDAIDIEQGLRARSSFRHVLSRISKSKSVYSVQHGFAELHVPRQRLVAEIVETAMHR